LWVVFALLALDSDSGSGSTDLIESGSNLVPIQKAVPGIETNADPKHCYAYTVVDKYGIYLTLWIVSFEKILLFNLQSLKSQVFKGYLLLKRN
jgi:hypothetical protein